MMLRVSTDPADPAYIDARPRKAWVNDREIMDWLSADEFRRCVIDKAGKVHNGSVRVERLPDVEVRPRDDVIDAFVEHFHGTPELIVENVAKRAEHGKPHIKAKKRR